MVFSFPANVQRWLSVFMTTTFMSIVLGSIFWQVRSSQSEQEDVNDRLALHYVVATVGVWPTLLLIITQVWNEKNSLARDVNDHLYGRFVYFLAEVLHPFLIIRFHHSLVNYVPGGLMVSAATWHARQPGYDPSENLNF